MGGKFVIVSLFVLFAIFSSCFSILASAEENHKFPNNNFIELHSSDSKKLSCGAEFEFDVIQVLPNNIDKNHIDFGIKNTSLFFNLTKGVLGQSLDNGIKTSNFTSTMDVNSMCYYGSNFTNAGKKIIDLEDVADKSYEVHVDNKTLGLVSSVQYSESEKLVENNSSFLIVTGSDACGSYGAYRMVNVIFEEFSNQKWNSEIDVYSLFFNKTTNKTTGLTAYPVVGNGTISKSLEGFGTLDDEIKLDNNIQCEDKNSDLTNERFGITINGEGIPNLNLPPIRPKN